MKSKFFSSYESFIGEIPLEFEAEVNEKYARGSFQRLKISSILFLCIIVISLARDLLTGFYHRPEEPYNFLHLISFALMIFSTLSVILFGFVDKRKPLSVSSLKKLHILFYININIALTLFMFNELYRGYFTTYEQFYWLFFAFVPLMHLRSNFVNMLVSFFTYLSSYIIIMIINNITFLNFIYIVPIFIAMEFFGLYLRQYYLKNIIYDIQNRILQKQLKNQSIIDPLTGCYNRYAMHEQFEKMCEEEDNYLLFMFDIDKFKMYNDAFSHIEGDICLNQISSAVMSMCHSNRMDLFRYGGEEFIVLSKVMEESKIEETAVKLLDIVRDLKIATPAENELGNIVTISVGAATVSSDLVIKDAIRMVDEQLYMAKEHGRNCAFYKSEKIKQPKKTGIS